MDFKSRPTVAGAPVQVWRGAWSAGTYFPGDTVVNDGATYVAVVITANEPPHSDWDEVEVALGGGALSDTAYEEDTPIGGVGWGQFIVGKRDDALSAVTPAEGDAVGLKVNVRGALWVKHDEELIVAGSTPTGDPLLGNALPVGGVDGTGDVYPLLVGVDGTLSVADAAVLAQVGQVNTNTANLPANLGQAVMDNSLPVAIASDQSALVIGGNVASDAADSGNPVKIGGKAKDSLPTQVAAADRVDAWYSTHGAAMVSDVISWGDAFGDGVSNNSRWSRLAPGGSTVNTVQAFGVLFNGTSWDRMRGDTTGLYVQGHLAHDAVDAGNPIKIGGRGRNALPTAASANNDRVDAWFDLYGQQAVFSHRVFAAVDAFSNSEMAKAQLLQGGVGIPLAGLMGFNGTDWDRIRTANTGRLQVDVVTGGGGGTQYTEDAAFGGNGTGTLMIARRDDALSALTPVENDAVGLRVNSVGALWVALESLPALAAGTNNIGDVDVLTVPADPFGANADAASATGSISAKLRFIAATGIPITGLPASTNTLEVVGDVAQDAAIAGNPLAMGFRASTALPTPMSADGDSVYAWANRNGAQVIAAPPHIGLNSDPYVLTSKTAQYTTTQTGTGLWTPASGKKLVITKLQIQAGGTVAGTVQVWFGGSADTTYTRGTDIAIFDGEFAPSATLKPGVVDTGPWVAAAVDDILRITDSAAVNPLTVTVWGYEI